MSKRDKKRGQMKIETPRLVEDRIYLLSGYEETRGLTVRARYHGEREIQGDPAYRFEIVDGPKKARGIFQARIQDVSINGRNVRYLASQGGNA